MKSAARPNFYSDKIIEEYLSLMSAFVRQNTEAFMSQIGMDLIL